MGCNGSLSKAYTETLGMPPERITTGHMVADTEGLREKAQKVTEQEIAALRKRYQIEGSLFNYVGRLHNRKGVLELLTAWRDFERVHPHDGTLLLIGEGEQEQALKRFIQEHALQGVRFAGRVAYDEIAPYYAASDVFVIPTLEDNWSLVVPEAMACGLPILCSKYNGCYPELVEPDGNGWVFDPLDGQDTLMALERCVENQENLAAMGDRSREIIANHTPAHAAESILEACRIAIAHRKR
jgi:glycosyltransferase involved in cell wall biosynthesis